jgi:hypothetical protein
LKKEEEEGQPHGWFGGWFALGGPAKEKRKKKKKLWCLAHGKGHRKKKKKKKKGRVWPLVVAEPHPMGQTPQFFFLKFYYFQIFINF